MKKRLLSAILSVVMIVGMIPLCTAPAAAEGEELSEVLAFDAGNIQPDGSYLYEGNCFRITGGHADSEHGGIYAGSAAQWLTIEAIYSTVTITKIEAEITYWGGWYNQVGISGGTKVEETAETGSTVHVTGIGSKAFSFAGGTDYCAFGNITVSYTVAEHEHDFSAYVINGDGTHSLKCTLCDKISETAAHTFTDYVCTACGAEDMTGVKADATAAINAVPATEANAAAAAEALAAISNAATVEEAIAAKDAGLLAMAKADAVAEINAATTTANSTAAAEAVTAVNAATSIENVTAAKDAGLLAMAKLDAAAEINGATTTANSTAATEALTAIDEAATVEAVTAAKDAGLLAMAKLDAVAEINTATTTANSAAAAEAITSVNGATSIEAVTAAKDAGLLAMTKLDAKAAINAAKNKENEDIALAALDDIEAASAIDDVNTIKNTALGLMQEADAALAALKAAAILAIEDAKTEVNADIADTAKTNINNAETTAEVNGLKADALLAMAKADAVAEINTATTTANGAAAAEAITAIGTAATIEAVTAAKDAGLLAMAKLDAKAAINAAKNKENEAIALQALDDIEAASAIDAVNSVKDTALSLMQAADSALAALKTSAIAEIEDAQTEVNAEIADTAKTNIAGAETTDAVNGLKADALLAMAKADAKAAINAAKNAENEAIALQALDDIEAASTIDAVNSVKDTALSLMQEADDALAALKALAITSIENAQTEVNAEIANIAKTNINNAETTDAVNGLKAAALLAMAKADAVAEINAATTTANGAAATEARTAVNEATTIEAVHAARDAGFLAMAKADAVAEINAATTTANSAAATEARTAVNEATTIEAVHAAKDAGFLAMAKADAAAEINAAKTAANESIALAALADIEAASTINAVNSVKDTALAAMSEADLIAAKAAAVAEIEDAKNRENASIADAAIAAIGTASSIEEVGTLKTAALNDMAAADAALAAAKADAIAEINAEKKPDNTQIAEDAITAIGNVETTDAIEPILTAALAEMDAVHVYTGLATDNGDGTHTVRCLTCDKTIREPHTAVKHECTVCGYGNSCELIKFGNAQSEHFTVTRVSGIGGYTYDYGYRVGDEDYVIRIAAKDPHYMITHVEAVISQRVNDYHCVDVSKGTSTQAGDIGYINGIYDSELLIGGGDSTNDCFLSDITVYYVTHAYSAETGRCACGEACIHTFDQNGFCTNCRCSIDSAAALEENIAYSLTLIDEEIYSDNSDIACEAKAAIENAQTLRELTELLEEWLAEMDGVHEYGAEYTDNGDGTHSRFCTSCGKELIEEHVCVNHVCSLCGSIGCLAVLTSKYFNNFEYSDKFEASTANSFSTLGTVAGINGRAYVTIRSKLANSEIVCVDVVLGDCAYNWEKIGISSGTKVPIKSPKAYDVARVENVNANWIKFGTYNGDESWISISKLYVYYVIHDFSGEYADIGGGKHGHVCSVPGCERYVNPEDHTYTLGICSVCGAFCDHDWDDDGICTICGCSDSDPEAIEAARAGAIAQIESERTDVNSSIADETITQINNSVSVADICSCTEAGRIRMAKADVAAELNARKAAAKCDEAKAFLDEALAALLDEVVTLLDVNNLRFEALAEADRIDKEFTDRQKDYIDELEYEAIEHNEYVTQKTIDFVEEIKGLVAAAPSIEALDHICEIYNKHVIDFCRAYDGSIESYANFAKYHPDATPAQLAYAGAALAEVEAIEISDYTDSTTGVIDVDGLYDELCRIEDYYWSRIDFYDDKQYFLDNLMFNMAEEGLSDLYYEITEEYIGLVEALDDPEDADELAILEIKYELLTDPEWAEYYIYEYWYDNFKFDYCDEMEEYLEKTFDLERQYARSVLAEAEESGYTLDDYYELRDWYYDERDDNYLEFLYGERLRAILSFVWALYAEDGEFFDASENLRSLVEEVLEAWGAAETKEAFDAVETEYGDKFELAEFKEKTCENLRYYPLDEYGLPPEALSGAVKAIIEDGCEEIWECTSKNSVNGVYYAACAAIDDQLLAVEIDIAEIKRGIVSILGDLWCTEARAVMEELLRDIVAAEDAGDREALEALITLENLDAVCEEAYALNEKFSETWNEYFNKLKDFCPEEMLEEMGDLFEKFDECCSFTNLEAAYEECRDNILFRLTLYDAYDRYAEIWNTYPDGMNAWIAEEALDKLDAIEDGDMDALERITAEYDEKFDMIFNHWEKVVYDTVLVKAPTLSENGTFYGTAFYINEDGKRVTLCDKLYDEDIEVTFEEWYLRTSIQYKETGDGGVNVRFVSMLDEHLENFYEAGFIYTVNEEDSFDPLTTQLGNTSYVADGKTVRAGDFGYGEKYFILRDVDFAKEAVDADLEITVTPYVLLADEETYLFGDPVYFYLSDLVETEEDEEAA